MTQYALTQLPAKPVHDEIVVAKGQTAFEVERGRTVRVEDVEGMQAVDFICYNRANLAEKFWAAHTAKLNKTIYVSKGHVLWSDLANPMMTIVEDTVGVNDVICGSCSRPLDEVRYGDKATDGCMENFEAAIEPWGLERKDIPMCFNIFLNYPVAASGGVSLEDTEPPSRPGDYIDLRAEMDLLIAISNCPQINNPCTGFNPTPIRVAVY